MTRARLFLLLLTALLAGCAAPLSRFTEDVRATRNLVDCVFHIATDVEFRSVRQLEPLDTVGLFRNEGRRYFRLLKTDSGRAVAHGDGWITVDFGKGIILQFRSEGSSGSYVTPGWGTITIEGDRYDIQVGVLSGTAIALLWEPATPTPPPQ
jgi:hypothetical protein